MKNEPIILVSVYIVPEGSTFTDGEPIQAAFQVKGAPVAPYAFRQDGELTILAADDAVAAQLVEVAQRVDGEEVPGAKPGTKIRRFDIAPK